MTPTDIDGILEYANILYIIIEVKFGGAPLPYGQELALRRLTDDLGKVKKSILIIAEHETHYEDNIIVHECNVTRYRTNGQWEEADGSQSVKEMCDWFIQKVKAEI